MRVLLERFAAVPSDRKAWGVLLAIYGLVMAFFAFYFLRRPVMWPISVLLLVIGPVAAVFGIAHEIYRRIWGTWGFMILSGLLGLLIVVLMIVGLVPPRRGGLCLFMVLAPLWALWIDRPGRNDIWMVPGELGKYVKDGEALLRAVTPTTSFHAMLGRHYLAQTESAAEWLMSVYDEAAESIRVKALYVEMNRFDINPDRWYLEAYALSMPPGRLFEDLWGNLGEYEVFSENEFTLTGTEDLQEAYADAGRTIRARVPGAGDNGTTFETMGITFEVITSRMQELVAAAHRLADRRGHAVGRVRVFANAHDTPGPLLCSPPRLM